MPVTTQTRQEAALAVFIVRRKTSKGTRFHVRYQESRYKSQKHLGAFGTLREAKIRQAWALDELAAGRQPDRRRLRQATTTTLRAAAAAWLASRVDAAATTRETHQRRLPNILDALGDIPLHTITIEDVQQYIAESSLAPRSIREYVNTLAQILDHARIEPNPARDKRIRYPRHTRQRRVLPRGDHLALLHAALPEKYRPIVRFLEATGTRISEATSITWADVEPDRVLIHDSKTTAGTRWVAYPRSELPERAGERVFVVTPAGVRLAMRRACITAGIPHIHPHLLRHLYASRRLHEGAPVAVVAQEIGHSHPGVTHSTYHHVTAPD